MKIINCRTFQNVTMNKCEKLYDFIYLHHRDFLNSKKSDDNKKRLNALALFYYNVLNLLKEILEIDSERKLYISLSALDRIYENKDYKLTTFYYRISRSNNGGEKYSYLFNDNRITYISFRNALDNCLEKNGFIKYIYGYHDRNNKDESYQTRVFVNFEKIYKMLGKVTLEDTLSFINRLLNKRKKRKKKSSGDEVYVEIKKEYIVNKTDVITDKNGNQRKHTKKIKKYDVHTYDKKSDLSKLTSENRKIIEDSLRFCELQKEIYSKSILSVDYDSASYEKQKKSFEIYYDKYKEKYSFSKEELLEHFINSIDTVNLQLAWDREHYKFRRIFHAKESIENFNYYGRSFGSSLDTLKREYKEILFINGNRAIEADLVSSVCQISALLEGHDASNVDFYNIEKLKDLGLSREDIKLGMLVLQNAKDKKDVLGSLYYRGKKELRNLMKEEVFQNAVYEKFHYLRNRHLNSKKQLEVLFKESELMIKVIEELYNKGIYGLYNFDAVYFEYSSSIDVVSIVQDVFKSVSLDMFQYCINIKLK